VKGGGGGGLGGQRGEFSDCGLLGYDNAYSCRRFGTTCYFEVVFRKGGNERKKMRSVHTWRHLVT